MGAGAEAAAAALEQCKKHEDCKDKEKANQCLVMTAPKDGKAGGEKVTMSFCVSKEDGEKMMKEVNAKAKEQGVEVEIGWAGASKLGFAAATLIAAAYF